MANPDQSQQPSLRARVLKGGAWTIGGYGISQSIRLVSNLIMTRLLMPEAFGLMAIVITVHVGLGMMTDFGINASVIRSKSAEKPAFVSTAWSLQIIRDGLIAILMAIAALGLWVAQQNGAVAPDTVYEDPRLCILIWVLSISIALNGFRSIKLPLAQRRMDIQRIIGLEISAQIFALITMVIAAQNGAGVYSLVIGQLASMFYSLAGSYLFFPGPSAKFEIHKEHFSEIFNYGKWLLIASLLGFTVVRGDQFVFGYLFEKNEFSLYAIATIWIMAIFSLLDNLQTRIIYPTFSELHRTNPQGLTNAYEKFRLMLTAGLLGIFIVLFFGSSFIFGLLYTSEYSGVAKYVSLLSIGLLLLPYNLLNSVILSSGDSKNFNLVIGAPSLALFTLTPVIFSAFNAEAAVVFFATIRIFSLPFAWYFASKHIRINPLYEGLPILLIAFFSIYAVT